MTLNDLKKYKHTEWTYNPNKVKIPANRFKIEEIEQFNEIYQFIKKRYKYVGATPSGGVPNSRAVKNCQRYIVSETHAGFELVACTLDGCYRFILGNGKVAKDNKVRGATALKTLFNTAKTFEVDYIFRAAAVSKEKGKAIKKEIKAPIISVCKKEYEHSEFIGNVHHLDFNSSYASRIEEALPELKPMLDWLYENRKSNNEYFKHVLTNSIGAMQSQYCIDIDNNFKRKPYSLALLSKIAINGTNELIYTMLDKLKASGRKPLLVNTDGIWYQGEIYHDENEGQELGKWKNDHINCDLYIKSSGAYQYLEHGIIKSVVRGYTNLDQIKPREDWNWKEIEDYTGMRYYEFDLEKGVVEQWED